VLPGQAGSTHHGSDCVVVFGDFQELFLNALFLTLLLLQGLPALPGRSGTVSGIVRTNAGEPAAAVRVSAMVPPESDADLRSASAFSALAETDEAGRYRLEGIPPGRYYIVAGRVDGPTYYPGTTDMSKARIFSIPPEGGTVSNIDFVIVDASVRTITGNDISGQLAALFSQLAANRVLPPANIAIPVKVEMEGGGKVPIVAEGKSVLIGLIDTATGAQIDRQLNATTLIGVPLSVLSAGQSPPEYRVSIENLPAGFVLRSIQFGTDDAMKGPLKIPAANMPRTTVSTIAGVTQQVVTTMSTSGAPLPTLTITLVAVPILSTAGVRVTGRMKDMEIRSVYLSGTPGILYSDGSFEFRAVMPGRYRVAAIGNTPAGSSLAASVVVGDRDLDGIELVETAVLPVDVKTVTPPGPAPLPGPGSTLPLVSLHGRLIEESSGRPIEEGSVKLIGRSEAFTPIGPGGQFEFLRLLPGTYNLEIRIFGHTNVQQPVVVGDQDIRVDVTTLKMY